MALSMVYTTFNGVLVHERTAGGKEREYTSDPLGSLVAYRSDAAGYNYTAEYWPYGEVQTESSTNATRWGFVGLLGYMRDLVNQFYVRARYYRADLLRWMTVDPLWPREIAYMYCRNAPIVHSDPSGLFPGWVIVILIALVGTMCALCMIKMLSDLSDIDLGTQDKRKHCVMACMLRMQCGDVCSAIFVVGTEIFDIICKLLGKKCNPTFDDVAANLAGYLCGSPTMFTSCLPWWLISPRPWCESCCEKLNYGGQGPGLGGLVGAASGISASLWK